MNPEDAPDHPWPSPRRRSTKQMAVAVGAALLLAAAVWAGFFYWRLPDVTTLKTNNPSSTALMNQRLRAAQEAGRKLRIDQRWVSLAEIPPLLRESVRISEDASFYQHNGVDLHELRAAIRQSWREKRLVRGASTITQQLAKNLYLSTDRTIWRKIEEYFIARRLEAALSKNRILHLYLNVIELGPGIFGVEAASQSYFGKSVGALTLEEIVRLVAVIPRPLRANPLRDSAWLNWRGRWILAALERYALISPTVHSELVEKFSK